MNERVAISSVLFSFPDFYIENPVINLTRAIRVLQGAKESFNRNRIRLPGSEGTNVLLLEAHLVVRHRDAVSVELERDQGCSLRLNLEDFTSNVVSNHKLACSVMARSAT